MVNKSVLLLCRRVLSSDGLEVAQKGSHSWQVGLLERAQSSTHHHVLADAREVYPDRDTHLLELICRAEAAELHDLRCVDGARAHDNLAIHRQLSCTTLMTVHFSKN